MRCRVLLTVLACLAAACAALAAPASASTPWTPGAVFVAAQGARYSDGGVFYTPPGSGSRYQLYAGTAEDVTVTSDGTVYWTTCSGNVYKYNPTGGQTLVRGGLNCATGIAVESNGDIVVSDFYHIYLLSPAGATLSTIASTAEARSIAVDPSNNIYFIDGSNYLEVLPAGAPTPVRIMGIPYQGQYASVRLGANSSLVLSLGSSPGGVAVLPLGGGTATHKSAGYASYGAVADTHGNLYVGDLVGNPSTLDQLDEFPMGSTTATTLANGYDEPEGLAVWPPVSPGARSGTTTTLTTTSPTSVTAARSVTLAAQVTAGAGGVVQFAANGQPLGNTVPVVNGVAHLTTELPKGSDAVTATYAGSASWQPSQSSALTFTVSGVYTKTTLTTSDPLSEPDGTTVNVTATVTSSQGIPDGYVEFFVNGSLVGGQDVDASGAVTQPIELHGLHGLHNYIRAVYDGTSEYATSSSNTLAFATTTPYQPTLTTNVTYGQYRQDGSQKVTITAKVAGYSETPRPSGTITADNGLTCTALHNGTAAKMAYSTCTAVLAGGEYDVMIDYSGDSTYAAASTDQVVYPGG